MSQRSEFHLMFPFCFTEDFILRIYQNKYCINAKRVHINLSEQTKIGAKLNEGEVIGYISPTKKGIIIPNVQDLPIVMPITGVVTEIHTDKYSSPVDSNHEVITIEVDKNYPKQEDIFKLWKKMVADIYLKEYEYGAFKSPLLDHKKIFIFSAIAAFICFGISSSIGNPLPIIILAILGWLFYSKLYKPAKEYKRKEYSEFKEAMYFVL